MGRDLDYITKMKEHVNQLGVKTISPSIYQQLKTDIKGPIDSQYFFKNPYDLAKYEMSKHGALRRLEMLNNLWVQNMTLRIDAKDPTYVPWAKSKLKEMKARMMLQGIDIMNKNWIVHGQYIFCQSASGYDYIRITGIVITPDILFFIPAAGDKIASLAMTVQEGVLNLKKIKYDVPIESISGADRCSVQSNPTLTKHSAGIYGGAISPSLQYYGLYGRGYNRLYIPTYDSRVELDQAFGPPPEDETITWEAREIEAKGNYSKGRNWITLTEDKKYLNHTNISLGKTVVGGEDIYTVSYQTLSDYFAGTYTEKIVSLPTGNTTSEHYNVTAIAGSGITCSSGETTVYADYDLDTGDLITTSTEVKATPIAIMGETILSVLTTVKTVSDKPNIETVVTQQRTNVLVEFVNFALPGFIYKDGTVTTTTVWTGVYEVPNNTTNSDSQTEVKLGNRVLGKFTFHSSDTSDGSELVLTKSYSCKSITASEYGNIFRYYYVISNTTTDENIPATVYRSGSIDGNGEVFSKFLDYDYNTDVSNYILIAEFLDIDSTSNNTFKITVSEPGHGYTVDIESQSSVSNITTKWRVLSSHGDFDLLAGKRAHSESNENSYSSSVSGTVISGVSCHVNNYNMVYTYLVYDIDNLGRIRNALRRVFGLINLDETIGLPVGYRAEFTVTPDNYSDFFNSTFPYLDNAAIGVHKR